MLALARETKNAKDLIRPSPLLSCCDSWDKAISTFPWLARARGTQAEPPAAAAFALGPTRRLG
eukprot:5598122-Alexandrium_andersonii.AAC.1